MTVTGQDYKWVIKYKASDRTWELRGFVHNGDEWSQDGAPLYYDTLDNVLRSISRHESETSRTGG